MRVKAHRSQGREASRPDDSAIRKTKCYLGTNPLRSCWRLIHAVISNALGDMKANCYPQRYP